MASGWIPIACLLCPATAGEGREAPDQLVVRVVDGASGAPVADAEVARYEAREERDARPSAQMLWGAYWGEPVARAHSDASGEARLARGAGGQLHLEAFAPGKWAELDTEAPGPVTLRLEPDFTLAVPVRDDRGRPAGEVPVALFMLAPEGRDRAGDGALEPFGPIHAVVVSSRADGVARFPHAQRLVQGSSQFSCRVEVALPLAAPVGIAIDRQRLGEPTAPLVLPPTGALRIECPGLDARSARIRRPRLGAHAGVWFSTDPWRVPAIDGVAEFPRVGVGAPIEYEVASGDVPPLKGHLKGPSAAGETVVLRCPGAEDLPVLVGRVLDQELQPVQRASLSLTLTEISGNAHSSRGYRLDTDAEGRFRFRLSERGPRALERWELEIAALGASSDEIELPLDLTSGAFDCGDLVLIAADAASWLARKDDDQLEAEYRRAGAAARRNGSRRDRVEACLLEMARRGGERWIAFLARELAALRAAESPPGLPGEVVFLTALRRAERLGDPLVVESIGPATLEGTFPELPRMQLRLRNADPRGESFHVTEGGSYRSGRFARVHVTALDGAGQRAPAFASPGAVGGGISTTRKVAPDEGGTFVLELLDYVDLRLPGEYRVRVEYHDDEDIADLDSTQGRICAGSPEFALRWQARVVRLTRAEHAALEGAIGEIDVSKPVVLVSAHWKPDLRFEGQARTPEDRLFRAGWKALPALLGALEDRNLEPARCAWVLGLLWDVTGIDNPAGPRAWGALGARRWLAEWPGASERGAPTLAEFGDRAGAAIDAGAQQRLVERWLARRSLVALELAD